MGRQAAFTALTTASENTAVREAAIDAALRRNPKLRFLVETYPDGAVVEATAIFKAWTQWCEDEGHKPGSKSSFGEAVAKVVATRRAGRRGVTTYLVPPMADIDWAALLGLSDVNAADAAGQRQVNVDTLQPPAPVNAGHGPQCRPDVLPDVDLTLTQAPCPDSLLPHVDVSSRSEKKGEGQKGIEVAEGGLPPPVTYESLHTPEIGVPGVDPPPEHQEPAPQGRRRVVPFLETVTEQVEAALGRLRLSPAHPQAASLCYRELAADGISRNQITLALGALKQQEDDDTDQGSLL
jgi:hypothetical protein